MLNLIKHHVAEAVISQGQLHNGERSKQPAAEAHLKLLFPFQVHRQAVIVKGLVFTVYSPIRDMMAVPMILFGNLKFGSHS